MSIPLKTLGHQREREREGVSEREMEGGIEGTYFFFPLPFISVVRYSSIS
jgi:hypothetical protein